MQAQSALVRPDGAVHFDAETAIDLRLALVVKPRHAEHDNPLRFRDPFQDLLFLIDRVTLQHGLQGFENFLNGLVEFRLAGVLGFDKGENVIDVFCRLILGCFRDSTHECFLHISSY